MEEACGDFECFVGTNMVLVILAKLDLHSLFRARCVCKSWYDLVLSQLFVALWRQVLEDEEGEVWAVVLARTHVSKKPYKDLDFYNHNLAKRSHTQLWCLKQQMRKRYLCRHCPFGPYDTSLRLLWDCSSNGLVCGQLIEDKECLTFIIGNPITNQWKILPPAPSCFGARFRLPSLPMSFEYDMKNCSYNLLSYHCWQAWDGSASLNAVAQYDSQLGIWQTGPGFNSDSQPAIDDVGLLFKCSLFLVERVFVEERGENMEGLGEYPVGEYSVAAYDVACMAWYHVTLPNVANVLNANDMTRLLGMFKHHKMGLVVPVVYDENLGFGVWSLVVEHRIELNGFSSSTKTSSWKPLASVSVENAFGDSWCVDSDTHFKVQLVGDCLIFSAWYTCSTFSTLPPLAYNLKTFTWCSYLNSSLYPALQDEKKRPLDFECCYAFLPNLAARP